MTGRVSDLIPHFTLVDVLTIADAWKTVGKDVDNEALGPLMNGQSHRARLRQLVAELGGQRYVSNANAPDNFEAGSSTQGPPPGPSGGGFSRGVSSNHPGTSPSRGGRAVGRGRGGGTIGSRGRGNLGVPS